MQTLETTWNNFVGYLPTLLIALAWLLVGTVIALVIAAVVRFLLKLTSLDDKLAKWLTGHGEAPDKTNKVESTIAQIVFWILEIFVIVAFFERLKLTAISQPLDGMLDRALIFVPRILAALVIALAAYLLAKALKLLVTRGLKAVNADRWVNKYLTEDESDVPATTATAPESTSYVTTRKSLAETLGSVTFWLILLLALPLILGVLELDGLFKPVENMIYEALAFLPNLLMAGLILIVGYAAAKLVKQVLVNLLQSIGVDQLTERLTESSPTGGLKASKILGTVAFVLILIPVVIAALHALQVESLTRPAEAMLQDVLAAVPNIFAAVLVLVLAYFVGRFLKQIVVSLLESFGFDTLLGRLNLTGSTTEPAHADAAPPAATSSDNSPSQVAGTVVLVIVMLIAVQEALELLGFERLGALLQELLAFLGHVVLGAVIVGVGIYLANLVARLIRGTNTPNADLMAKFARYGIIVVAVFMGLSEAGVGETIVQAAFIAVMAGGALALGLAFGLGGRDAAKKRLDKLEDNVDSSQPPVGPQ